MRLDAKTARKIATGRLQTKAEEITEAIAAFSCDTPFGFRKKGAAFQRKLEERIKAVYGAMLIGCDWTGKVFHFFVLEVQQEENGRPIRLEIFGNSVNIRSGRMRSRRVAIITTHALERLMERRSDVDIVKIASQEFTLDFVGQMVFGINGMKLTVGQDFDIRTANGSARGTVGLDGVPVVTTWIHKPGGWEYGGVKHKKPD